MQSYNIQRNIKIIIVNSNCCKERTTNMVSVLVTYYQVHVNKIRSLPTMSSGLRVIVVYEIHAVLKTYLDVKKKKKKSSRKSNFSLFLNNSI